MVELLLRALLVVTMTLHLATVGVAGFAPLVCVWLEWRATSQGDTAAARLGRRLAWQSLSWLAAGLVLGLAALGLLWSLPTADWFAALAAIPRRRLWFGGAELVFSLACMWAYAAGWDRFGSPAGLAKRMGHRLLAVLAASNLLYHFPPLFSAIAVLETRPELAALAARFVRLLAEPEVLARTAHHLLAGLAVTGVLVMVEALRMGPGEEQPGAFRHIASSGARISLAATLFELPVGVYLLVCLPPGARHQLLGGDALAVALFGAGLVSALGLLHHLTAIALGDARLGPVARATALAVLTMLSMVALRERVRERWSEAAPVVASPPAVVGLFDQIPPFRSTRCTSDC